MMLLNILATMSLKRLYFRQRPSDHLPPRALKIVETDKQSGLPSSMLISATTFTYALLAIDSWVLHLSGLNQIETWSAALIAVGAYIVVAFAKVHLGQNYPSDCLFCLPVIAIIIGLWHLLLWLDSLYDLCPSCLDINGNESFCYFESTEIQQDDPILIMRSNFAIGKSNSLSTAVITLLCFLLFSIASWPPIELWHKTPYFIPTLLSLYLFENILLCPCEANDWRTVNQPQNLESSSSSD